MLAMDQHGMICWYLLRPPTRSWRVAGQQPAPGPLESTWRWSSTLFACRRCACAGHDRIEIRRSLEMKGEQFFLMFFFHVYPASRKGTRQEQAIGIGWQSSTHRVSTRSSQSQCTLYTIGRSFTTQHHHWSLVLKTQPNITLIWLCLKIGYPWNAMLVYHRCSY